MVKPNTQPLAISIDGQMVNNNVSFDTIELTDEIGPRVGSFRFTLENGLLINPTMWQKVLVQAADLTTTFFIGFIDVIKKRQESIRYDYDIECAGLEMLLEKAIITGGYSGTENSILADLLGNAYPDLSNFFDFSTFASGGTSNFDLELSDSTLLDALSKLSDKSGANYNFRYANASRVNFIKNPTFETTMDHFGGTLVTGTAAHTSWSGTWLPSNVAWGAGFGETAGGVKCISQDLAGGGNDEDCFIRIGRANESAGVETTFRIERRSGKWLRLNFRMKPIDDGAPGANKTIRVRIITYTEDGTMFSDGTDSLLMIPPVTEGAWSLWDRAFDMSDGTIFPDAGWVEFQIEYSTANDPGSLSIDDFTLETIDSVAEPAAGTYFDGDTANAFWYGVAHDRVSYKGNAAPTELLWGLSSSASFDVDVGNMNELIFDLELNFNGIDAINSVIVVGGTQWKDIEWIYPSNGELTHFDLETIVYPAEGDSFPVIAKNTGSDVSPAWTNQTVTDRPTGFTPATVLFDLEEHWVEWETAPSDLDKGWRIIGRIKERIRVRVDDSDSISANGGLSFVTMLYDDTIESPTAAHTLAQFELDNRQDPLTISFSTYEPGLNAGDEIDIIDSSQSLNTTVTIKRVTRRYLGGGFLIAQIEAGDYAPGLEDILSETHDWATPEVPFEDSTTNMVARTLVDADGAELIDADGASLFDIAP